MNFNSFTCWGLRQGSAAKILSKVPILGNVPLQTSLAGANCRTRPRDSHLEGESSRNQQAAIQSSANSEGVTHCHSHRPVRHAYVGTYILSHTYLHTSVHIQYASMYICTQAWIELQTCVYTHIHTYMHTYIHANTHMYIHPSRHTYIQTHTIRTHVYIYTDMFIYICIHVYAVVYVYVYVICNMQYAICNM